ncbi:DUF4178 domain-containing protein [Bacillota bacterium Lsc_1132]
MKIFRRLKNMFQKTKKPIKDDKDTAVHLGDVVEIAMVTYQVIGRTEDPQWNAVMLTLENGSQIQYLLIEHREKNIYSLFQPIDGRMDTFHEIPTTLEIDDSIYYLEEQYSGLIKTEGRTPLPNGEQYVWKFQSDERKLARIEWQDGKFMLYEGESVMPAEVRVLRGT